MTEIAEFEASLADFEQAWQGSAAPAIADFVRRQTGHARLLLLVELVSLDLEYRWCLFGSQNCRPMPWLLEDYVSQFSELGSVDELPIELIGEEYRVRQRWGDRPHHKTYFARFPQRLAVIAEMLDAIDEELRREADDGLSDAVCRQTRPRIHSQDRFDPRAPLSYRDFVLKQLIGAGGTGKVYRAWQHSLERYVAVKYLRKSLMQSPEAIERFIAEAKIVAQLHHPGIVAIHGLGKTHVGYFFSMELIEGQDLSRVAAEQPVRVSDAIGWLAQASEAIEHAHQRGIIHCDLKPGNLLLDGDGVVHVTDFGFARIPTENAMDCARMEGTAAFMAPEQISDFWGSIGPQTDVYGLGAVLFTLLAGRPPWNGRSAADVLSRVVSAVEANPVSDFRADVSTDVAAVIARCLAKAPAARFQTALDLKDALLRIDR